MKKIIKNPIFTFIIGAILFGSIGAVSAYTLFANGIGYTPSDSTWKKTNGDDITNVKEAIDELYSKTNRNVTFSNPIYEETLSTISSSNRQQIIDLTKGEWVVTFIRNSSWNRSASTNFTGVSTYSLVCNNGSLTTTLTGKTYQKSGDSPTNNSYITARLYENIYLVNVSLNNDTCFVEYKDSGDVLTSSEITAMHAIKINY